MEKSSKVYLKALNAYNNRNIEKASYLCEKGMKISMKNAALLNLKGLILYLKGDIEDAQKIWEMNYRINHDSVSQKYLNDSLQDSKKFDLYIKALKCIEEFKINEALDLLFECSKSDYNFINVNNYIAVCYIKSGNYEGASQYIQKVLEVDCKNEMALQNRKLIRKYGYKLQGNGINKTFVLVIASICIIVFSGVILIKNKIYDAHMQSKSHNEISKVNTAPKVNLPEKKSLTGAKKKTQIFPYDEIKKHIESKNFDEINEDALKWKDESLNINQKALLSKGISLLKTEGTEYFYEKGMKLEKAGNHEGAVQTLKKAYDWGKSSYLYQHIIYFIGVSSEEAEDVQSAIKYYKQYDNTFAGGGYDAAVLYNLAALYDSLDDVKAQDYAHKLIKLYPKSIYNNTKVNYILSRKYN